MQTTASPHSVAPQVVTYAACRDRVPVPWFGASAKDCIGLQILLQGAMVAALAYQEVGCLHTV
ncbi:hypothetical protein CK621_04505 [Vandammella animalimorsus]|uniref:Uncharacterized protein n=1 Tax=Vandammella animalimorsus TaxID=2029117 RepID=A0A2A2B087_9BURK|nr:hypothetical protein CK621_04505 [Vandammella animalimorsus]